MSEIEREIDGMDFGRSSSLVSDAGLRVSQSQNPRTPSLSRSRARSLSFLPTDNVLILFYYGAVVGRGRLKAQGTEIQASRSQ